MTSPIATMAEPLDDDRASAIIVLVYEAREALSLAERQADPGATDTPNPSIGINELSTGLKHLGAALELSMVLEAAKPARLSLNRAIRGIEATIGHVHLYQLHADENEGDKKKLRNIWRRSAEEAKREAHRALHKLSALFPNAYDTEEDDEDSGVGNGLSEVQSTGRERRVGRKGTRYRCNH